MTEPEKPTQKKSKDNNKLLYKWMGLVVVIWIASWVLLILFIPNYTERGQYGDMFGAINALFAGLAFAGIIYTIYLQKKELALQRKELRQTRDEFITQNNTLKFQRFENTFFQMVTLHNEIVDKLHIERTHNENVPRSRRECFIHLVQDLQFHLEKSLRVKLSGPNGKISDENFFIRIQVITQCYKEIMDLFDPALAHYFRNLYQIIKFVHLSNVVHEKEEKQFYINIVRAQLSPNELATLYFGLIVENYGFPKFKFLADTYELLQNLDYTLLSKYTKPYLNENELKELYESRKMDFFDARIIKLIKTK